jgi:hypothetical protein
MTTERVKNYFQGIFVREFTLFAGEELECHLEEEQNGRVIHMDDRVVKAPLDENGQGRYELLNQIAEAGSQGKEDRLQEELENYLMLEHLTETLFTLQ